MSTFSFFQFPGEFFLHIPAGLSAWGEDVLLSRDFPPCLLKGPPGSDRL